MSGKVSEFLAKYKYGARPNLFKVFITGGPVAFPEAEFYVKGASIPGRTIGSIPIKYLNNTINYPGDTTFADWNVTVLNDEKFLLRNAFEAWMEGIKSNAETSSSLGEGGWAGSADVYQLDLNQNIIRTYKFFNIFPNDLATIDLSFDSTDQMEEFGVTFSYSHWELSK